MTRLRPCDHGVKFTVEPPVSALGSTARGVLAGPVAVDLARTAFQAVIHCAGVHGVEPQLPVSLSVRGTGLDVELVAPGEDHRLGEPPDVPADVGEPGRAGGVVAASVEGAVGVGAVGAVGDVLEGRGSVPAGPACQGSISMYGVALAASAWLMNCAATAGPRRGSSWRCRGAGPRRWSSRRRLRRWSRSRASSLAYSARSRPWRGWRRVPPARGWPA